MSGGSWTEESGERARGAEVLEHPKEGLAGEEDRDVAVFFFEKKGFVPRFPEFLDFVGIHDLIVQGFGDQDPVFGK